ncbi:hypothetical protein IT568_08020 [bacterium]|nr:hypothetical protein [bacterium]
MNNLFFSQKNILSFLMILTFAFFAIAGNIFNYCNGIYDARSGKVTLAWEISSSNNLKEFKIKRSSDENFYTVIGTVIYVNGQSSFEFVDSEIFRSLPKPSSAVFYYRIEAMSQSGSVLESKSLPVGIIAGIHSTWGSIKALLK